MTRRIGVVASIAVVVMSAAYGITLAGGLRSLASPQDAIGDPWFSILELQILLLAPLMVFVMAAIHDWVGPEGKTTSLVALVFTSLLAGLTCSVHFVILAVGGPLHVTFAWPSIPYALDILAWDGFFGIAMLFAAAAFHGDRLRVAIRVLATLSGTLALAGFVGVATGELQLRMIGVVGYAVVYPVVIALVAVVLRRRASPDATGR